MEKRNSILFKAIFIVFFIVFFTSIFSIESLAIDIPVQNNKNITFTFDEKVDGYKQIDSVYQHHNVIGWHHSGGYWSIGGKRLYDRDIPNGDLKDLDKAFLQKLDHRPIKVNYPPKVKEAIKEGKKVKVRLRINSKYFGANNYVYDIDKPGKHKVKHTSNGLELLLPLKFNYEEDGFGEILTYQPYGINLKFQIPIIKRGFGQNGYSIYKSNGNRSGEWASYWNYDQPVSIPSFCNFYAIIIHGIF